jgi:signal transduction histidine kinase/ADP-ribose pyrophosphatase YjhB (NUDIX family)
MNTGIAALRRYVLGCLLALPMVLVHLGVAAQTLPPDTPRRILVIYSDTSTLTANVGLAAGLRDALNGALTPHFEVNTEFRAIQQFPGAEEDARFVEMLTRRYADQPVDLVIAIGPAALEITLQERERFAPGAPVVAGGITERSLPDQPPDDLFVALGSFDLAKTVALARRMQPDARRIVVFAGSAEFDERWLETAQRVLADETGIEVAFVSNLPVADFEADAAALGSDTILLILTIFEDATGARFIPAEAAARIASSSGAPSWGVYSTFIDNGVVGGVVQTFETIGRTVGELALDVLDGEGTGARLVTVPSAPVVDWLAMRRYGLDEERLPADTVLLNYDPPVWERYRAEILIVLGVVVAQTLTIAALVLQGRRKRAAEMEVAARRLELAQLARIAQLGELSGAITHELNQPLTSIMANAEAGSILLRKSPIDVEEISNILADIAADDQRASKIITSLRKLMHRNEVDPVPVDLNVVVRAVQSLTRSELLMRSVRLVVNSAAGPLTVLGDMEQFQQVLLNLVLNGADAMAGQAPDTRLLLVETGERGDGWRQIVVQDFGPGLSDDLRCDPFRAFVTTKDKGMGMGLAISRSIAEAHGGTLAFVAADRGARVVFALPPA